MKQYVIEGPGGTRSIPTDTPDYNREFTMALNTQEALHWVFHNPDSPQSQLSKTWLKKNYGTDKLPKIRKMLAKTQAPKKTWQENPLVYAVVIITLTVSGSLLTRYLGDHLAWLPKPNSIQQPVIMAPAQTTAPTQSVQTDTPVTLQSEDDKDWLHRPKWLRLPWQRKDSEP